MSPVSADGIGLLTVAEAAEIAGLPTATIRVWIWRYPELKVTRWRGELMLVERAFLECERARRTSPQRRVTRRAKDPS